MTFTLNYDEAIHLDAEALAEGGIGEAYESLLPKLRAFVANPAEIQEDLNDDARSYSVRCGDMEFIIYAPHLDEETGNGWGIATVALFSIVNEQLKNTDHRLYAINGGNDLFGIFLSPTEASAAQNSLTSKTDWPYLPNREVPWYGRFH